MNINELTEVEKPKPMPGIGFRLAFRLGSICLNIHPFTWYLWPAEFAPSAEQPIHSRKFLCFSFDRFYTVEIIETRVPAEPESN